jgi:hypothetical protein
MKYGNCLIWAILQKIHYGGYLRFEAISNLPGIPRTFWSPDKKIWYRYKPLKPVIRPTKFQKIFPYYILLFKGRVVQDNGTHSRYCRWI